MKLLLDENLSWRMVKKLTPFFSEVLHVSMIKRKEEPLSDYYIWNFAKLNEYTIISKDDDFEKIVLIRKAPPKLILLKTFNLDTNNLIQLIIENKEKIISFIESEESDIFEIYSN